MDTSLEWMKDLSEDELAIIEDAIEKSVFYSKYVSEQTAIIGKLAIKLNGMEQRLINWRLMGEEG